MTPIQISNERARAILTEAARLYDTGFRNTYVSTPAEVFRTTIEIQEIAALAQHSIDRAMAAKANGDTADLLALRNDALLDELAEFMTVTAKRIAELETELREVCAQRDALVTSDTVRPSVPA